MNEDFIDQTPSTGGVEEMSQILERLLDVSNAPKKGSIVIIRRGEFTRPRVGIVTSLGKSRARIRVVGDTRDTVIRYKNLIPTICFVDPDTVEKLKSTSEASIS